MLRLRFFLPAVFILMGVGFFHASGHQDMRLVESLAKADAVTRSLYERTEIQTQVANVYRHMGLHEKAEKLMQGASGDSDRIQDVYLRDKSWASLSNAFASMEDFDRAFIFYGKIQDANARIHQGWKLSVKLGKSGKKEAGEKLLETLKLEVMDAETAPEQRAEWLTGTGAAYKAFQPEKGVPLIYEAYGLAQTLDDLHERTILFNEIGAHLMDVGHKEMAMRIFRKVAALAPAIEDPQERAETYAMLGGEQAEKGARESAAKDLEEGVKAALQIPEGEGRHAVLSEIARNFGQSHRYDRGLAVAAMIPDAYHRSEGHIRIAKNMARTGEKDRAGKLLKETAALVPKIENPFLKAIVLRKLAAEWVGMGNFKEAEFFLEKALDLGNAGQG